MKQQLTDRQADIAIALRAVVKTPTTESWGDFTDFISAVSVMVVGAEGLIHPIKMQESFFRAWKAYGAVWSSEHNRILRDCLGGQKEFDRVKNHPNGRAALGRILSRVQEVHGDITPGMKVDVEVGDILFEELQEETM